MRSIIKPLLRAGGLLLLIMFAGACKKSTTPDTTPTVKTSLAGTIDGKPIAIDQSAMTSTYYSSDGDAVKALSTSATLNASGDKLNFFISDVKAGTQNLTKKLGTSSNPGHPGLKVNDTGTGTSTTTQTYIQYVSSGNTYYAISGTVIITITGTNINVTWNITFSDAANRSFTSTGSFTYTNYVAVTEPKTKVTDPTPVALKPTIENIAPTQGMAGDTVAVTGVNYSTVIAENAFKFNNVDAKVVTATATQLKVIVPATGTTGTVSIKVKNSDVVTGPTYTYLLPATITSIAPLAGKIGDTILIKGTNFATTPADNLVKFKGITATVIAATATQLNVRVPQGATTGNITLSVKGRAVITTGDFIIGVNSLWADLGFTGTIADYNQAATLSTKTIFTGGLKPNYLYLTTNGTTFTNVYDNLPFVKTNLEIHLIAANDSAFYVTTNLGIAKSINGSTWTKLTPNALSVDMGFTGMVATGNKISVINGATLYNSTNGGASWTTTAVQSAGVMDYITSDSNGKYWYAVDVNANTATATAKIFYRSTDQGKTWIAATANTGYYFYGLGEQDFIKASSTAGTFLLYGPPATVPALADQRLYKTTSQGDAWVKVSDEAVNVVKISGTDVMYGGVTFNLSKDNGTTFTKYIAPTGYTIYGIEKANGYYYIFCTLSGTTTHKIFRALIQ